MLARFLAGRQHHLGSPRAESHCRPKRGIRGGGATRADRLTGRRLSKTGAPRLRVKLYMGVIAAIRRNAMVRQQYARLRARGKAKMSALGAAMRKRVQIAFGVLKHSTVYNSQVAMK